MEARIILADFLLLGLRDKNHLRRVGVTFKIVFLLRYSAVLGQINLYLIWIVKIESGPQIFPRKEKCSIKLGPKQMQILLSLSKILHTELLEY